MNTTAALPFPQRSGPALSNGRLGMMLLIGTETVLFTSFIGAYLVLRLGAAFWPPAGTPVLRVGLSAFNTAILVLSSGLVLRLRSALRLERLPRVKAFLGATFLLGVFFLFLQGVEFHRLYERGLTLHTGAYGAVFFSLIGCHGLHVLGGLAILAVVWARAARGFIAPPLREWVGHAELYWHFVTGVWLILFGILYIL